MNPDFWMTLEGLLEHAEGFAKRMFEEKQEVMPMFIAVAGPSRIESERIMVIGAPWSGEKEKELMLAMVKAQFIEHDVERYAFLGEGWMINVPIEEADDAMRVRPSNHPKRVEVLQIVAVDRDRRTLGVMLPILRDYSGAMLGEPQELASDFSRGRMMSLLTPATPLH